MMDWNDKNPWNVPPSEEAHKVAVYDGRSKVWKEVDPPKWWDPSYGYNEWNWRKPDKMQHPSKVGCGGQISINGWYKGFVSQGDEFDARIDGAVAYGWCANVSPFAFNWALETLNEFSKRFYSLSSDPAGASTISTMVSDVPPAYKSELSSRWSGYIFPSRVKKAFAADYSTATVMELGAIWDSWTIDKRAEFFQNNPDLFVQMYQGSISYDEFLSQFRIKVAREEPYVTWDYFSSVTKEIDSLKDQKSLYILTTEDAVISSAKIASPFNYSVPADIPGFAPLTGTYDDKMIHLFSSPNSIPSTFNTEYFFGNPHRLAVPGLSTFLAFDKTIRNPILTEDNPVSREFPPYDRTFHPYQGSTSYTNGTDCSGFVTQAIGYRGNNYIAGAVFNGAERVDPVLRLYSNSIWTGVTWIGGSNVKFNYAFTDKDPTVGPANNGNLYEYLYTIVGHLVPGDIIVKDGHVMIISEIDPRWVESIGEDQLIPRNKIDTVLSMIKVIQASGYIPKYRVGVTDLLQVKNADGEGIFLNYIAKRMRGR